MTSPSAPVRPSARGPLGVVVPLFDGAEYIDAALSSIAAQSLLPDEVVVVDDGSTDGGAELLECWADLLPLRVVRHERNCGLPTALRTGISVLSTPLVAQLDADDIWLPDNLETLTRAFDNAPGLVSADALRWVPERAVANRSWYQRYPLPAPEDQMAALIKGNWVFGSTLLARDDYDSAGGYRDHASCEDWDLWLRMLRNGVRVTVPQHPTMLYRLRPGSVSRGEKLFIAQLAILANFIETSPPGELRKAATAARRRVAARLRLQRSYDAARNHDTRRARSDAMYALRGDIPVKLRAAVTLAVPSTAVRLYDRVSLDPRWQVNR